VDLDTKVRKLKLKPLTDKIIYDMALDKSIVYLYKRFDYYKEDGPFGHEFYSVAYLNKNSIREIKRHRRQTNLRDFKGTWYRYSTRLNIWLMFKRNKVGRLIEKL